MHSRPSFEFPTNFKPETPPNVIYHTPRADFPVDLRSSEGSHDSGYFSETPGPKSANIVLSASGSNEQHFSNQADKDIRKSPNGMFEPTLQFNTVSKNTPQLIPGEGKASEILRSSRESGKFLCSARDPNMVAANRHDAPPASFSNSIETSVVSSTHLSKLRVARSFVRWGCLLESAHLYLTVSSNHSRFRQTNPL